MPTLTKERMLTISQAARTAGYSTARIRQLARAGSLSCVWTPLGRLFHECDIQALAEQRAARQQADEKGRA
jgi:hypothetical protein